MKSQDLYIHELDILRMFAAVAVVIFHFGIWSYPFRIGLIEPIFQSANIAVGFFFFLSGFILVYVSRENFKKYSFDIKNFYKKRLVRILPAYFLAMFLMGLVYPLHFGFFPDIKHFILEILLLQSWIPGSVTNVNFVAWSLSVEIFFYLLFPLLFKMLIKNSKTFVTLASAFWVITNVFVLLSAFGFNQDNIAINQFTKFFPLFHLNIFMFGMFFSKLFITKNVFVLKLQSPIVFIGTILFFIIYAQLVPNQMLIGQHDGLLLPLFITLVFGVFSLKGVYKKILNNRLFMLLGKASYGIYIYQVVIYYFMYWFYKKIGVFDLLKEEGRFFVFLVVLLFASVLSYEFFEKKIRNLLIKHKI